MRVSKKYTDLQIAKINKICSHLEQKKNISNEFFYIKGINEALLNIKPFNDKCEKIKEEMLGFKIDLIIENAKKIIEKKIELKPNLLIEMVIKILKNISEHADVELCVCSLDYEILSAAKSEIISACSLARKIHLVIDDKLSRGSILVKANKSVIDAQISTQLEQAKNVLLKTYLGVN